MPKRRFLSCLKEKRQIVVPLVMGLLSVVAFDACADVDRVVMAPPSVPGAHFVGSRNCADCQESITKNFVTATHAKLKAHGANSENIGCESCHGPGSVHSGTGGARNTILNPDKSPEVCFECDLDMADNYADNSAVSVPYNTSAEEHWITETVIHRLNKAMQLTLHVRLDLLRRQAVWRPEQL